MVKGLFFAVKLYTLHCKSLCSSPECSGPSSRGPRVSGRLYFCRISVVFQTISNPRFFSIRGNESNHRKKCQNQRGVCIMEQFGVD